MVHYKHIIMKKRILFLILVFSVCLTASPSDPASPSGKDLNSFNEENSQPGFIHIDLSQVVNMGFYDPVPGDGVGGWADFGPTYCIKAIPYGVQIIRGWDHSI